MRLREQQVGFLYGLLVGVVMWAGYVTWLNLTEPELLPPSTWQEIGDGFHALIPPPDTIVVIEVRHEDGVAQWRLAFVPFVRTTAPAAQEETPEIWRPPFGQDQDNLIVEASKIAADDDRDGVLTVEIPLFFHRNVLYTGMTHICCGCALVHKVDFQVFSSPLFKAPALWMRWTVDKDRTHRERVKKFGPNYWAPPRDDFGAERQISPQDGFP